MVLESSPYAFGELHPWKTPKEPIRIEHIKSGASLSDNSHIKSRLSLRIEIRVLLISTWKLTVLKCYKFKKCDICKRRTSCEYVRINCWCQLSNMFILSFISARLSHLNIVLLFWLKLGFPVTKYYGDFPSNVGRLGQELTKTWHNLLKARTRWSVAMAELFGGKQGHWSAEQVVR